MPKQVDPAATFPPALMRPLEAAQYLAVSARHLITMQARKDLPCVRIGRRCVRFRRADLDAFIQQKAG